MEYNKDIPDYGDVFSVKEFIEMCKSSSLVDYDGIGYPVKKKKVANMVIIPSNWKNIPEDATHIVWFNR